MPFVYCHKMKLSFVMLATLGMVYSEAASLSKSNAEDTLVNLLLRELLDDQVRIIASSRGYKNSYKICGCSLG